MNGVIDEVRASSTARSAQWISTEYNNQSKPTEFAALGIEEVSSPTALSSFGYRKAVTIDHTKVAGDLANFPVLINLPADASLAAHAQTDADDVLFVSNSVVWNTGTVNDKLASEIESYNSTTGNLQAWVKVPNLSSTTDTVIYMYYGNGSVATQQNKTAVWDANTKMVQHMNQNPGGTVPQMTDSSSYSNNGSSYGTMVAGDLVEGKVGRALDFDGTDDSIDVGNGSSLNITDAMTISAWVKSSANNANRRIITKLDGGTITGYDLALGFTGNGELKYGTDNGTWQELTSAQQISDGSWHQIVAYYDRNGGTNNKRIYYDGAIVNQATYTGGLSSNNTTVSIGSLTNSGNFFIGQIDEARISNVARSTQWIATEYNNQSQPTEFATLGIEEVSSPAALSSFKYRKTITIDHTKVAGNLVNFPVLINLASDADLQARAQSDGDDILFAASGVAWNTGTVNDKLASEIESYNSTTGSVQAWVKIPSLSSTVDTVIYLYYGNSSITSQQNKTAVWDGNAKMVQHMNQTGTGAAGDYKDSTQYGNNSINTAKQPVPAGGQIDGAESFDGVEDYMDLGNRNSLNMSDMLTIEAWAKPNSGYGLVAPRISEKSLSYIINMDLAGRVSGFAFIGGVQRGTTATSIIPVDSWSHIVYSVNTNTGAHVLYINGVVSNTRSYTGKIDITDNTVKIGDSSGAGTRNFTGTIDEVRVSNTARSAQWIQTEYNNQSSPSTFYSVAGEIISRLEITGSATQVAGVSQPITLYAKDAAGNTMTGFSGDKSVILTGGGVSPNGTFPTCSDKNGNDVSFNTAATLTFTNGIASCNMKLYKAETATISSINFATQTTSLAVTVSPGTLGNFLVNAPASANSGTGFATTITARDPYHNTTRNVSGSTTISASTGTISPASISAANFTDDGVWSGNITISDITEQPTVTLTATNGASSGTDAISILGIPQAPGSVSASRQSDIQITVSWQDSSTVEANYDIERRVQTGGGWGSYAIIASASAGTTSFVDNATNDPAAPPQADRAYQYRVRGQNTIGYSPYTTDASVHFTTPNTPSGMSATHLSDTSFRVNYTDNAAATDTHRIQRCSNADCSSIFGTDLGVFSASPQTDSTGISCNSRYRWQARSETPDSLVSNYALSTFEYTTPAAPTIGTPAVVSANQITVNWTDNSAYEDGFRIEVSMDGGAYSAVTPGTNTVGADINSYSFTSLGDHNYKFRVRAHIGATAANSELLSPYSSDSSVVYTPSAPPSLLAPVANSSTSITWNWLDNSAYEEAFRLHFIEGSHADVDSLAANSTSYETTGLLPNTRYQTHMHSYRSDTGESVASTASSQIYTLANVPDNLTATLSSQDHMSLNWQANSNPSGTQYLLENMNTGDDSGWITASAFTTTQLRCETEYSFRVKARNGDGVETAFAPSVSLMSSSCGAPLPAGFSDPPAAPAGDFGIVINDGSAYTNSTRVKLAFKAGSDAVRMAVSDYPDLSDASVVSYQSQALWDMGNVPDGRYTVYARFYTQYGVPSKVVSDSIILDTTPPALAVTFKDKYYTNEYIILAGKLEAGAKIGYNIDNKRAGVITGGADGSFYVSLGAFSAGSHLIQLFSQDSLGNASSTQNFTFTVDGVFVPAKPVTVPNTTVGPSTAPSQVGIISTPTPPSSQPPVGPDVPSTQPPAETPSQIPSVPSGVDIPAEAPPSLQGDWNLLTIKPFPKAMTSEEVQMILEKFPQFKSSFQEFGISDFSDTDSLKNVSLNIPSLSETIGLGATDIAPLNLPAVGTPVAQLSAQLKKGIPENVIFVKTKDSNIDVNSVLSFEEGSAGQKVSLLSGKAFQLILRPDGEVNSVKGYLTLREGEISQADENPVRRLARALLPDVARAEEVEEKLVLSEFSFGDEDQDGIWTADISAPAVSGKYELITVLDYKDVKLGAKTLRLITVVDPEGYVYRKDVDGFETRIPDATVSIYWFNPDTNDYELWDAGRYQQTNPQKTDGRGTYSFLVPPGTYYLKAAAAGHSTYQSDPFDVEAGSGVHMNIELKRQADWKDQITWQNLLIVVFGIGLFYNFYSDRKLRKKLKQQDMS